MIWVSFAEGFMFGLGAAIPLGPINILIMSNALRSYPTAVAIGFGAMSADIVYLLLILFGMVAFIKNPTVMLLLGLAGSIFLLYMAWMIFKGRKDSITLTKTSRSSIISSYIKGLTLTLLNPYTIIFWISVSTYIQTRQLDTLFTVVGMFAAIVMWITLMPLLVYRTKHLLSQKAIEMISVISAAILLFFASAMLYRLLLTN